MEIKIQQVCYRCNRLTSGNPGPEEGWYNPYFVKEGNSTRQTLLCPDCSPRLSLFLFCRRHPKWRFLNMIYASLFHYFWLPCTQCGRYYGGHEKHGKGINYSDGTGKSTCSFC